ncbi:MAG TPA: DUF1648 domain-containing protein [Saprospiraceae bacterium]|nr:DUF1648 domain-containing protein [Saprospiraceae bacterium]
MESRPKLILELSPTDKFIEAAGWAALLLLWGLSILYYTNLPEIIPTHFDSSGQVNAYGSKMSLMFLPVLGTLLVIGLTILNMYPHIFNYPVKVTKETALRQYINATRMLRFFKLMVVLVISLMITIINHAATNNSGKISFLLMPITLGMIILPLVYFTIKAFRIK